MRFWRMSAVAALRSALSDIAHVLNLPTPSPLVGTCVCVLLVLLLTLLLLYVLIRLIRSSKLPLRPPHILPFTASQPQPL